jgi:superoxide dismutase, Fe-Mn family
MTITRRSFLGALSSVIGTLTFLPSSYGQEGAANPQSPTKTAYEVKPLPFDPSKLKGLSERLITSHHQNNYAGAVKRLNAIQDHIRKLPAQAQPFQMGSLKREELIAMNSMILHEYYFANLGGDGKIGGDIQKLITQQFGSYEGWEHEFRLTGQSLSGGSGWVMLAYSPRDKRMYNVWSSDHTVNLADGRPILAMDMYEHSYQMDYGANAKAYIDAFFQNINWEAVDMRTKR